MEAQYIQLAVFVKIPQNNSDNHNNKKYEAALSLKMYHSHLYHFLHLNYTSVTTLKTLPATEKKFENMSFTKSSPSSDRSSFEGAQS